MWENDYWVFCNLISSLPLWGHIQNVQFELVFIKKIPIIITQADVVKLSLKFYEKISILIVVKSGLKIKFTSTISL